MTLPRSPTYGPTKPRSVDQLDPKTGEVLATFFSTREAERQTGYHQNQIVQVCKGRGHTAGGYKWRYTP
jgi:hypothetical protein